MLKNVALAPGDVVRLSDGGLTTIVNPSVGQLVQHTGGFFDPSTVSVELVNPAPNRIRWLLELDAKPAVPESNFQEAFLSCPDGFAKVQIRAENEAQLLLWMYPTPTGAEGRFLSVSWNQVQTISRDRDGTQICASYPRFQYRVAASVRQVGAIGKFYREVFHVTAERPLDSHHAVLTAWCEQFSNFWELYHLATYEAA